MGASLLSYVMPMLSVSRPTKIAFAHRPTPAARPSPRAHLPSHNSSRRMAKKKKPSLAEATLPPPYSAVAGRTETIVLPRVYPRGFLGYMNG